MCYEDTVDRTTEVHGDQQPYSSHIARALDASHWVQVINQSYYVKLHFDYVSLYNLHKGIYFDLSAGQG